MRVLAVLAIGAMALFAWVTFDGRFTSTTPAPTASAAPGIPPRPADAFALSVTYVFDGDTFEARMPQPNDIVATIYRVMGLDHHTELHDRLGRAIPATQGEPVKELFGG